jgi:hypothetical protein
LRLAPVLKALGLSGMLDTLEARLDRALAVPISRPRAGRMRANQSSTLLLTIAK